MRVATKLRAVFGVYVVLLGGLLVYLVRTSERAVATGHDLTAISARLRATSTDQLGRISRMSNDAEKYVVTNDAGYLDDLTATVRDYGAELRQIDSLPLSTEERARITPLVLDWAELNARVSRIANEARGPGGEAREPAGGVVALQTELDRLRAATEELGAASEDAMSRELASSDRAARGAARFAWVAAASALLLGIALSALIVRSIVAPLQQLARGTREVSAGRFDYRLAADGGDEFAQVARDFNAMTARLDELDRMKRDFVSRVSHDLKTPLSSMHETIGALLDELPGPLSPKQRQLLELTRESGQRLSAMLAKLLDLSRIEAGLSPDFAVVDVAEIVGRLVDEANAGRLERGTRVTFADRPARQLLRGDAAGLRQVFENLIENALKFSPAGDEVVVRVEVVSARGPAVPPARWAAVAGATPRAGAPVLVTVADHGPGVPDAEKERIFARFYQTEAGRAVRGRGVGLGLTICQDVVRSHGGAIWVSDNAPRGSVFSVLLPRGVVPADGESDAPVAAAGAAA